MPKRKVSYEVRVDMDGVENVTAADVQWAIDRAIAAGGTTEARVHVYSRRDDTSVTVSWSNESED